MFIQRHISKELVLALDRLPVLVLVGPRQSGKSTLVKTLFNSLPYVNLEGVVERDFATNDPRGFIKQFPNGAVIDEVQRVPNILSEIQVQVDRDESKSKFVITGSENLLLSAAVTQSLAGRASIHTLYPLCLGEMEYRDKEFLDLRLFEGFYPRIIAQRISAKETLQDYVSTYIERDVRQTTNIGDLALFRKFITLCANRIGQLLNKDSLSSDVGVSPPTIERWLSILEATFVCVRLAPWHTNTSKRLIKMPKLYFLDTGVACSLLGIRSSSDLASHPLRGPLFENLQVIEVLKTFANRAEKPRVYFFRDHIGNEVDLVIELSDKILPIEIKSAQTYIPEFSKGISYIKSFKTPLHSKPIVVLGGDDSVQYREDVTILPWNSLANELVQRHVVF